MLTFLLLSLLPLAFATEALNPAIPNHRLKIFGGHNATQGEFPYMVSIRKHKVALCGGSIITKDWVLTAAHCFNGSKSLSSLEVLYGTIYNTIGAPKGLITRVKKLVAHRKFDSKKYLYDAALLQVVKPFNFNHNVRPVRLPHFNDVVPYGQFANLTGWGKTLKAKKSVVLQKVTIQIHPPSQCVKAGTTTRRFNGTNQICAGGLRNSQCTGDAGSPLVYKGVQHGIVSVSHEPCGHRPGILTKVTAIRRWISEIVKVI